MNRLHRLVLVPVLLAAPLVAPTAAQEEPTRTPPTAEFDAAITAEQFRARNAHLASDAFEGRESGTAGGDATEEYVEREFRRLGLKPLPGVENESFRLPVDLKTRTPLAAESRLELLDDTGETIRTFEGMSGALPFAFSAVGQAEGGVAFVGYGLVDPEEKFDEYAGIDVKGKLVIVLRHGPRENDPKSPWSLRSRETAAKLSFARKAAAAHEAGAAGVLLVNDYHHEKDQLPVTAGGPPAPLPVLATTRDAVDALLAPAEVTLRELQARIEAELVPHSFVIEGMRARATAALSDARATNVVGYLPGSDPKLRNEAVLVCAHIDHVGRGFFGSPAGPGEIHNGADDNASGTAALLELVESFSSGDAPRRSIVFAGWCGEEKGLLGSRAFVASPSWPLTDLVACLNLDMVGRYGGAGKREASLNVGGAITGEGMEELLLAAAEAEKLTISQNWEAWSQSDHAPFYRAGVPALFVHTGIHADYHRPTDDWWKVDAEGGAAAARMIRRIAVALADADTRPKYAKRPPTPVLGVRLGEAPDGVLIGQVTPGFGAAAAGMLRGDVVIRADGQPVKTTAELVKIIQGHAVGDVLVVEVRRGEKVLELDVELKGR